MCCPFHSILDINQGSKSVMLVQCQLRHSPHMQRAFSKDYQKAKFAICSSEAKYYRGKGGGDTKTTIAEKLAQNRKFLRTSRKGREGKI